MKAVILSKCPEANIVDITHQIDKFDIRMGAFVLASAVPYFPAGTIHIGVVDPGVGSRRRPLIFETGRGLLVGPDNGLLVPAAQAEGLIHVFEISNRAIMRDEISATFHGRDVFAPTAAHLASGLSPSECGPEVADYMIPPFAQPIFNGKSITCEILHVDGFGNIVTNVSRQLFSQTSLKQGQEVSLSIGKRKFSARVVKTYSDLASNEIGVLMGSHGFLEVACREKSAAKRLRAKRTSVLRVYGA